jgi:predicted amidophosphoribosyltransferase
VRALLLAYKEHGQHALAGPLGSALAHAVAGASAGLSGPVLLVPVPSGTLTVLRRGDDVVGALAGTAARTARAGGLPVRRASALRQAGRRRDQVGLGRLERRANMVGAFEVRPRLRATVRGAQVVVVDDIVTSGATLAAAARVLASAGAHVVAGAVVAATPARG